MKKNTTGILIVVILSIFSLGTIISSRFNLFNSKDDFIVVDTINGLPKFELKDSFTTHKIYGFGEFSLPVTLERKIENTEDVSMALSGSIINKATFQQKGLNYQNPHAYNNYARILVRTEKIVDPQFSIDINKEIEKSEFDDFKVQYFDAIKNELNNIENFSIQSETIRQVNLNGQNALELSYLRQLNENPVANVKSYLFRKDDILFSFTMSYRAKDSVIWKNDFAKVLNSLKIYFDNIPDTRRNLAYNESNVPVGNILINLPEFDGMKECYSVPIVKRKADESHHGNEFILGYYLNNKTYSKVDSIYNIVFDDFLIISASNEMKQRNFTTDEYNSITKIINDSFIKKNWDDLKEVIENNNYYSVGRPILISNYSVRDNASTYIIIIKYQLGDYETVSLLLLNTVYLKGKIINLAYTKFYEGENSITDAKAKNDYMLYQFLDENN